MGQHWRANQRGRMEKKQKQHIQKLWVGRSYIFTHAISQPSLPITSYHLPYLNSLNQAPVGSHSIQPLEAAPKQGFPQRTLRSDCLWTLHSGRFAVMADRSAILEILNIEENDLMS